MLSDVVLIFLNRLPLVSGGVSVQQTRSKWTCSTNHIAIVVVEEAVAEVSGIFFVQLFIDDIVVTAT